MLRCSLLTLSALALPVAAQDPIRLSVQPARSPQPALKFQLLPEIRDLKPGNAALLYQRAHSPEWYDVFRRSPDYPKVSEWIELPLDKLPVDRVNALLPRQMLTEVDTAARRASCDWDLTARVRRDGFAMMLPEMQCFREFATLLMLRARLEMRAGTLPAAIFSLQTGLGMARHIAEGPTLIHGLVGAAIANNMLGQIEELVQQDGATNLYWALTDLPRPFVDMRRPLQAEKLMFESMVPGIRAAWKDPQLGPLPAEKLNRELARVGTLLSIGDFSNRVYIAVAAARIYPEAKKYLIDQGYPAARADALPVIQVALMYSLAMYDVTYDDFYRWTNLPYWEAQPGLMRAEKQLARAKQKIVHEGGIPVAEWLMPAVRKVLEARVRVERRIAALRCIEALRLHAADNQGAFPAKLADVKIAPIPIDPATGKSFEYRLEDYRALLIGPGFAGERTGIRYELTLRSKS
ncbi:MAG: hypothetical protein FJ271_18260 [Planctomycetes bacterium]|nr:hypothetical protein [Planctomycetota bacterium]